MKMTNLKKQMIIGAIAMILFIGPAYAAKISNQQSKIQMAILLDTSGSMDGLIEQAKTQLWRVVNELISAKHGGSTPKLEVALYEYGKDTIPASESYLRMIVPFTTDLDRVSDELFKLRTNGGSEYCGTVIKAAVEGLNWSKRAQDYKVIFIAGNEPFTQGKVPYAASCISAKRKGINVNTIFCGDYQTGINTQWRDGAIQGAGSYMNIDHNKKISRISAPQDDDIIRLGKELNNTYISYGVKGKKLKERQKAQDANAMAASPQVLVQRTSVKASKHYKNDKWDLVDAEKEGKVNVESLKKAELPKEMKEMSVTEKRSYIKKMGAKRAELQKKIKKLKFERDLYINKKRKEKTASETLDNVIIRSIKKQAKEKKFKFKK